MDWLAKKGKGLAMVLDIEEVNIDGKAYIESIQWAVEANIFIITKPNFGDITSMCGLLRYLRN